MIESDAINLLHKYSSDRDSFLAVLNHSQAVKRLALKICDVSKNVDSSFVAIASILHDIGRFSYPPGPDSILHGVEGARILRSEGLDDYALVCERHIGIGITKDDIIKQGLPLPLGDYVPISNEEIIVCYADNLIAGAVEQSEDWFLERMVRELGEDYRERVLDFFKKVHEIIGY